MKIFLLIVIFLCVLVVLGINTLCINRYLVVHSKIHKLHSYYFLKVLIPQKEVNDITNKALLINNKKYKFRVYKIDDNVVYKEKNNFRVLYLEIFELDDFLKVNGYQMDVIFVDEKKKIIDYLKEKEE